MPVSPGTAQISSTLARPFAQQVRLLEDLGLPVLALDPTRLLESPQQAAGQVARLMGPRGLVLALEQTGTVDAVSARRLSAALATAAAPASARATVLLATGGETARAVLDSLGVRSLTPVSSHAAVITSSTRAGLVVMTRPGSHGASASSLRGAVAPYVPRTDPPLADLPENDPHR
jgi:hypothetical protein